MQVHLNTRGIKVVQGDSLEVLKRLPDNSIHAVVTDPPYGLSNTDSGHVTEALMQWSSGNRGFVPDVKGGGFMGKAWDSFVPPPALWDEVFRVLKPGGHLLCFAGTRTFDIMGMSIRLAGFDMRDTIEWIYGSGFPKSLDVTKAIDRTAGVKRERVPRVGGALNAGTANGWSGSSPDSPTAPLAGTQQVNTPITEAALEWTGWGTALKPAHEPILVAQKPFKSTVAVNVLTHGTGALNIDASRVAHASVADLAESMGKNQHADFGSGPRENKVYGVDSRDRPDYDGGKGRWPANLILQHSEECVRLGSKAVATATHYPAARGVGNISTSGHSGQTDLVEQSPGTETVETWECTPDCPVSQMDAQSGIQKDGVAVQRHGGGQALFGGIAGGVNTVGSRADQGYGGEGGASRFFYQAKAPKNERPSYVHEDGRTIVHPTVKPLGLMRYLVKMVTPPGGIVLDPFPGSGSTTEAALLEGFKSIAIEKDPDYIPLIVQRITRNKES